MQQHPYIVFGRPTIGESEIEAVTQTLRSGWLGTGPQVQQFQKRFAEYMGVKHAVAVGSCTAALHLSLEAAGIGAGDEVITTPLTFAATANAIVHAGATPVFADVDPATMNLDPDQVKAKITERTKAILPVHFAGRPCDMTRLGSIAQSHGLTVIEDCAHAIEAFYHGQKVGALGDASCFSFYVTKNMTTAEGGMLCTNRDDIAEKARVLALHGMSADAWSRFSDAGFKHYEVMHPGYKYNMTDIQASLGLQQMAHLPSWLASRERIWNRYGHAFAGLPCITPAAVEHGTVHARHLYPLLIDPDTCGISRDEFLSALHHRGIGSGVHYRALHTHPYYRDRFDYQPEDFPNANRIGLCTASIPLSPNLTEQELERIEQAVSEILTQ